MIGTLEERFWDKVRERPDIGCWEWSGSRDMAGYGKMRKGRKDEPQLKAHRVSWELANGPIPEGMAICHTCDNPPCVRPDHLFAGTIGDNNRDMHKKGRATRVRAFGEDHGNAVLTVDLVREVRRRKAAGETYDAIEAATGVKRATICGAVLRRNWAWLDADDLAA